MMKNFKAVKSYLAPPDCRAGLSVLHYIVRDGVNDYWLGVYHEFKGGLPGINNGYKPKGDHRDYRQCSRTRISKETYLALKTEANKRRREFR